MEDNSTTEVGLIFEAVARFRDEYGCSVLMIDHTGHSGERLRGASGKGDDGDYVLRATYEGELRGPEVQRTLTVLKLKDEESSGEWPIALDEAPGRFPLVTIGKVKVDAIDPDDWTDQLRWPLPGDVMTLEPKADKDGRVRRAGGRPPLALFMRLHAPVLQIDRRGRAAAHSVSRDSVDRNDHGHDFRTGHAGGRALPRPCSRVGPVTRSQ